MPMKLRVILKDYMGIPAIRELADKTEADTAGKNHMALEYLLSIDDPESMSDEELESLLRSVDRLLDMLFDREPEDEKSEEYKEWELKIYRSEDLRDAIEDVLSERKKQERNKSEETGNGFEKT